jgi:hypothetical protein
VSSNPLWASNVVDLCTVGDRHNYEASNAAAIGKLANPKQQLTPFIKQTKDSMQVALPLLASGSTEPSEEDPVRLRNAPQTKYCAILVVIFAPYGVPPSTSMNKLRLRRWPPRSTPNCMNVSG